MFPSVLQRDPGKVHNVVPQSELMAKENAMAEMEEEISMMKMRLQNIEDILS